MSKSPQSIGQLPVDRMKLARGDVKGVGEGLVAAHFTERELFQIRNACRDSDNENALRFLNAALARAEAKS